MSPKTPPIQQGLGLKSDTQTEGLEKTTSYFCMIFPFLKTCSMQKYAKNRVKKKGPGTTAMLITCVYVLCAETKRASIASLWTRAQSGRFLTESPSQ